MAGTRLDVRRAARLSKGAFFFSFVFSPTQGKTRGRDEGRGPSGSARAPIQNPAWGGGQEGKHAAHSTLEACVLFRHLLFHLQTGLSRNE